MQYPERAIGTRNKGTTQLGDARTQNAHLWKMTEVTVGPAIALSAVAGAVWDLRRWGVGKWAVHSGLEYLHASGNLPLGRGSIERAWSSQTPVLKLQCEEGPLAGPMVNKRQIHHADKA